MTQTARTLNRATLARQMLLEREPVTLENAMRRLLAIQAQCPPSPFLALWSRVAELDLAAVDAAFADGRIVKATLMRQTLHVTRAEDHTALHLAMQPTLRSRLADRRFRDGGATAAQADALLPDIVTFLTEPRSNAEVDEWLAARGLPNEWLWWALRTYGPVRHAPSEDAWSFPWRPRYLAAGPAPVRPDDPEGAHEGLQTLILRYLAAFGPATRKDIDTFAMVRQRRILPALAALGDRVERFAAPDGVELLDVPGGARPDGDTPAPPRLLPMWDNTLLAYADRSRVIPDDLRALVIRVNGDVLPTLLVDGYVAGVWRTVDGVVEATAYRELSPSDWAGLDAEAAALTRAIADRDPDPYRRYDRWWSKLPPGETRRLGI